MYLLQVMSFLALNLENIAASTGHWCDIVLPSLLSQAYVSWLCVFVQSDAYPSVYKLFYLSDEGKKIV